MTTRTGFTVIELLVVLSVLGLIVAVTAVSGRPSPYGLSDPVARARRVAARQGASVVLVMGAADTLLALPDGRVLHTLSGRRR